MEYYIELKQLLSYAAIDTITIIKQKWPNDYINYLENIGDAYFKNKKYLDASIAYKLAFEEKIFSNNIFYKLSNTLYLVGEYEESKYYATKMYELEPDNTNQIKLYIEILLKIGNLQEINDLSTKLIESNPNDEDYKFFLAHSKRLHGYFDEAVVILEHLCKKSNKVNYRIALADTVGETDTNLAIKYYESIFSKKNVILPLNKFNLSIHYLRSRNFKNGWNLFEYGLDKSIGKRGRKLPYNFKGTYRLKDSEDIKPNKKILICSEQGIGDQILFYNVFSDHDIKNLNIFVVCEKRMELILKRSFPFIDFSSNGIFNNSNLNDMLAKENLIYFPLGSFYSRFRPSIEKIEISKISYLTPNLLTTNKYKNYLKNIANGRKIIGICWKSFVDNNISKIKNIDFINWLPLFSNDNLIVNLQYGDTNNEQEFIKNLNLEMISFNEIDFKNDLDSWLSLSCACDGIISVSSSIVHFAGAAGQKVSVVMPFNQGHWSLGLTDKKSLFYPNVRIYRLSDYVTETSLILDAYSYLN